MMERTMRLHRNYTDELLRLSPPEVRSLMWLARHGKTVMSDFAQGTDIPLSTATRIVNRLVKKNIVVRHRSEEDRRIVEIDLSAEAYEHRNKFMAARQEAIGTVLEQLDIAESQLLLELLEKGLQRSSEAAGEATPVGKWKAWTAVRSVAVEAGVAAAKKK
jgi:DNA-binding MarR family transcriptional regulator